MSSSEFKQNQVVITNNFITREYKGYSIFLGELLYYVSTFPEKNTLESLYSLPCSSASSQAPLCFTPQGCDSLLFTENPAPTIDHKS